MPDYSNTPARTYSTGIGDAVADRTINRTITTAHKAPYTHLLTLPRQDDTSLDTEVASYAKSLGLVYDSYNVTHGDDETVEVGLNVTGTFYKETWADVAERVAVGSALLNTDDAAEEHQAMRHHLRQASILMSGRHLQHGDDTQPSRPQEVFTNCLDGSEKVLTQEYGPVALADITGQTVHVVAGDGEVRPAIIHQHGIQTLQRVTFRTVKGGGGKFRNHVKATPNHRWLLRDGTITTELSVGDVIQANPDTTIPMDPEGVVHGLIFGDGTAHKSRNDHYRTGVSQGRTYASIRVCAKDVVQGKIHTIMDDAGYPYTTPPHANGDRVYYLGKLAHAKELPHTCDPGYIKGFLYGWWLADGSKSQFEGTEISTADEQAAAWLEDHAAYAGYTITMHRVLERTITDGSFANGKALHCLRMRKEVQWKVEAIEAIDPAPVYCPEEPVTNAFVLANGLLTGNCSTSAASFLTFYLLLNGSGVGRAYDNAMMQVDYSEMPIVVPVIDMMHADSLTGAIKAPTPRDATHLYRNSPIEHFMVPDSREGWAKAVEMVDLLTFQGKVDTVLLLDFSNVRPNGAPIRGMQDRPASGPGPIMDAIGKLAMLRGCNMPLWRQAMYADHFLAECVLVGGARRAARMATKTWRDHDVIEFVHIKRPLEYLGLSPDEIIAYQKDNGQPMGFLWSSNNSITVDEEFWQLVKTPEAVATALNANDYVLWEHANNVLNAIAEASYYDGTGEPGIINQEKLTQVDEGFDEYADGEFAGSERYQLEPETKVLTKALAAAAIDSPWKMITNPCVPGDTPILTRDGYAEIESLVDRPVEVWNGNEFAPVTPFRTGFNPTLRVEFSDGTELRCTPAHKFVLHGDRYHQEGSRKEAQDLRIGDKLAKYTMPVVTAGDSYGSAQEAYSQGFYSGDGNTDLHHSWLYAPKYPCQSRLVGTFGDEHSSCERKTWKHGPMIEKSWVPINGDLAYCLSWLAGLLDADGAMCTDKEGGQSFQVTAVDKRFLQDVRLMLTRMGAQCALARSHEAKIRALPDGKGGHKAYQTQDLWRLVIRGFDAWMLVNELGLQCERLQYTADKPQRDARRFASVVGIYQDEPCETFCFTEELNHTGTFNGIVTGQCGEITLVMLGAYCVIADVVPYLAGSTNKADRMVGNNTTWDADAEDAFRVSTRALIRTNTMDCLYRREVDRTNRIGVGITGLHEYAYARFGYGWKDIVDEAKSQDFWQMLARFKRAVDEESITYSAQLGVNAPHTTTTIKPAGTTSKLFGLTEGAHLPSMREYLRWVQFRNGDPIIKEYADLGYPIRELKSYNGTTIVGFPTRPEICSLGMGDKLITAAEATPEEQYQYLRLLEKYWIRGVAEDGVTALVERGNQVSYTLKYDPEVVSFEAFKRTLIEGQSTIRCCSVMPQTDSSAYEYQPEQPLPKGEYEKIANQLKLQDTAVTEDIGFEHVDCGAGGCPIDFN